MSIRQGHELDATLAGANLFAWFGPAFGLLLRYWPITLGAGVAALLGKYLVGLLPWPTFERGFINVVHGVLDGVVYAMITVTAYRLLALQESRQTALGVNSLSRTLILGIQVYAVWTSFLLSSAAVVIFIGGLLAAALAALGAAAAIIVLIVYGVLGFPILLFILSPLWAILSVAGALTNAHAVRGEENGFGSVLASLRLSVDQKWRVFWPSYAIGQFIVWWYAGLLYLPGDSLIYLLNIPFLAPALTVFSVALALAMTFVVERAYAPHLGLDGIDASSAAASQRSAGADPSPVASAPAAAVQASATGSANAGVSSGAGASAGVAGAGTASVSMAAPAATPSQIATQLDKDLRSNQTRRLVELTEQGLAADPRFFLIYPESTITLAKKLGQLERADLGVKVLSPFLKDHRAHRLHLTGALLAAGLLGKDRKRLPEAARFLERVKALYPNEPMVDQLIKSTAKAMAAAGA